MDWDILAVLSFIEKFGYLWPFAWFYSKNNCSSPPPANPLCNAKFDVSRDQTLTWIWPHSRCTWASCLRWHVRWAGVSRAWISCLSRSRSLCTGRAWRVGRVSPSDEPQADRTSGNARRTGGKRGAYEKKKMISKDKSFFYRFTKCSVLNSTFLKTL